jgi:hypothetical protein
VLEVIDTSMPGLLHSLANKKITQSRLIYAPLAIAAQKAGLISHALLLYSRRGGRTGPLRQETLSRPGRTQHPACQYR